MKLSSTATRPNPAASRAAPMRRGPLVIVPTSGPLRMHADLGELTAAHWGDRALARDVADDPTARCALVHREGAVLCLEGAAWALSGRHGGLHLPGIEHAPLPGRRYGDLPRHLRLTEADIDRYGHTWVTTPARTALDCARLLPDGRALTWVMRLIRAGLDIPELVRSVEATRVPPRWSHTKAVMLNAYAQANVHTEASKPG